MKEHKPVERREKELVVNREWLECVYLASISDLALTGDERHIGEAAFVGYLLGYSHQYVSSDVIRLILSYNQEEI